MKKIYLSVIVLLCLIARLTPASAQCNVDFSTNDYYGFNDPNGGIYTGYLCGLVDSVGTFNSQGYYDGDGYVINLIAGFSVTFEVSDCNGNPVSLTVVDSGNVIVAGAYSPANCPNSVTFTPTYTGQYAVVMNLNGICAGGGSSLIGQVHAKIATGMQTPDCPPEGYQVNDTICGATPLILDASYVNGNTQNSYPTDPLDLEVYDGGFNCSEPNNTMWYSFTPASDIDTMYVHFATTPGSAFYSWLGYFSADSMNSPCTGTLTYLDCLEGFDDNTGLDTVMHPLYGLTAGTTYYFMVDGFEGQAGDFSIRLESSTMFNTLDLITPENITLFPNPATTEITIQSGKSILNNTTVTFLNVMGEVVYTVDYSTLQSEKISTASWSRGVYIAQITSGGVVLNKRILVR